MEKPVSIVTINIPTPFPSQGGQLGQKTPCSQKMPSALPKVGKSRIVEFSVVEVSLLILIVCLFDNFESQTDAIKSQIINSEIMEYNFAVSRADILDVKIQSRVVELRTAKLDIGKVVAEGVACLLCHVELCDVRRPSLEKKVVVRLNHVGELSRLRGPSSSHRLVVVLMSHRETERRTDPDCHGEIQEFIVRVVISTQLVDKFGKESFIGINGDAMSVTKNSHSVEALVR